jgi:putative tryptophan/tyrosine transport system substrate-binding protein
MAIQRREIIVTLGSAVVWPLAVRAQQPAMPVVGFIRPTSPDDSAKLVEAFRHGLSELGYIESRNVLIEYRYAYGQMDRLPGLAADLVSLRVSVLVATGGTVPALGAKAATTVIPIVFTTADEPVRAGLVASLNRPGGNLTGISAFAAPLGSKRLGLLRELLPAVTMVGFLINPKNPDTVEEVKAVQEAARAVGVKIVSLNASTESEIDTAFAKLVEERAGALMLGSDAFFRSQRNRLAALAAQHRVPTIDPIREYPVAGGLISYGPSLTGVYRQAGVYAGRILKGDKPANLPVQLPTAFELVINLKTAKALGLEVPPTLLARADEVIE